MLKVLEGFTGYGSHTIGLKRAGIPHKVVGVIEKDERAAKAYKGLNGTVRNIINLSTVEIDSIPDFDLFTYSYPTGNVSLCNHKKEVVHHRDELSPYEELIKLKKPKYLLLTNVIGLLSKDHHKELSDWEKWLSLNGYTNYRGVLNSKDFNVPQHRERVVLISILGEHKPFKFPIGPGCSKTLDDILENKVEAKYDINPEYLTNISLKLFGGENSKGLKRIGNISETYGRGNAGGIYKTTGLSPTLIAGNGTGGNNIPHILEIKENVENIRRLTPIECFRLMDLSEDEIRSLSILGYSDSQLYRLAGNGVVISMLKAIYNNLFTI